MPDTGDFKFIKASSKPRGTPSCRLGRIIFAYDKGLKSYYLFDSNRTFSLFDAMCRRNRLSMSVISNMLKDIESSFDASHQRPCPSESKSLAYVLSMNTLYLAVTCFCMFALLVFLELYYETGSGVAGTGIIFGYLGLFFCAVVIFGKGKTKICMPSFKTSSIFIDSYHRHEIFDILNSTIKNLNGLILNLGKNGLWIELEENE